MPKNWQYAFDGLKHFIVDHPEIEIGMNSICIPGDVRAEFYKIFDKVRTHFVEDNFLSLLEEGRKLSDSWRAISLEIVDSMKLDSIDVPNSTKWFLLNPSDGLSRGLIGPLFELLKGNSQLSDFEVIATRLVNEDFARCFPQGYALWSIVSMLKLISADKLYYVPIEQYDNPSGADIADELPGNHREEVPAARETKTISFLPGYLCTFLVPMIIAHSKPLDLFVSFRSDFREPRWKARAFSSAQEWLPIPEAMWRSEQKGLWPDLLIYANADYKELNLIADHWQIARPDIIVEFREDKDWYQKNGLGSIRPHYYMLNPKLGSFIVCREPIPEVVLQELAPESTPQSIARGAGLETVTQPDLSFHAIDVGYEMNKLDPIITAIRRSQSEQHKSAEVTN